MTLSSPAVLGEPVASDTVRVASVPSGHVYVAHLAPIAGDDRVVRLPDPPPAVPDAGPGQWWPPAMLDARWIDANADDFDVFHLHFGFDALTPDDLRAIVRSLREHGKPLVLTVHDLRNPHHADPAVHDAHLDVLVPAADRVVTLTRGAAEHIARRWGRRAQVLPHPHVLPLERLVPRRARTDGRYVVGVHAKSLRANTDPGAAVAALLPLAGELPDLRLVVDVHREVADATSRQHDAELMHLLTAADAAGQLDLHVHDRFDDAQLWHYLGGLDLSVLPYRFGTHSGWLEACHDLGTAVAAPDCGFYAEQRPCLTYRHGDAGSLRDAVRRGYRERPVWQADRARRADERDMLARAHRELYDRVLA